MGSSMSAIAASASAGAAVVVKLDQSDLMSGQPATGKVYLDVQNDSIPCTSLAISLIGSEITVVHYTTKHTSGTGKNKKTRTTHHYAHGRSDFLTLNVPLVTNSEGWFSKGQYEYPFRYCIFE